jgi:hypothetical protein
MALGGAFKRCLNIELLHMDIQGAETEVLELGFAELQAKKIVCVIVSIHCSISGDPLIHQKCLHLLRAAGGKIVAEHDVFESLSGDGLICAYFGERHSELPEFDLSYCRSSTSYYRDPAHELQIMREDFLLDGLLKRNEDAKGHRLFNRYPVGCMATERASERFHHPVPASGP